MKKEKERKGNVFGYFKLPRPQIYYLGIQI